jgi:hypothetical protein
LHLPIEQARVCRLDVAQNFIMMRPVIDYLSAFLTARYYKRTDIGDKGTVSFCNGLRKLLFYDKTRELEKHKQEIPDSFRGKNILRYECQFMRRIGKQFGRQIVTAENLYDEVFYRKPVKRWNAEYYLIQKVRSERALNMRGQREYLQSLALYGLQNIGGAEIALDLIKGARQRGEIGDKMSQRLKKLTIAIVQAREATEPPDGDFIRELDEKVGEAFRLAG